MTERVTTPLRLSSALVWALALVCLLPAALHVMGVDLGVSVSPLPSSGGASDRELYGALRGAFLHTFLEGGAVTVALTTGGLAFLYYRVAGGIVAPVLALALLYGGMLDGFHILASDYLISARADDEDFLAFSWAIARLFNASILALGAVLLVASRGRFWRVPPKSVIAYWAAALGVLAFIAAVWVTRAGSLPESMPQDSFLTRPADVIPLALYVVVAGLALPPLLRTEPTPFVQAVWLSMVPAIATQAYMAFGSTALFDHFFNSAHALKVLSYGIPLFGLLIEYQQARLRELEAVAERTSATVRRRETERRLFELEAVTAELQRSNRELEQFAYVASHDLRAPIRAVSNLTTWLAEDVGEDLSEKGREYVRLIGNRVERLDALISSLLRYARVGRRSDRVGAVESAEVVEEILELVEVPGAVTVEVRSELPSVLCNRTELHQVFMNLLSNAVRHARSRVVIQHVERPEEWHFSVADDGEGIEPQFHDRIWGLFTRLEARDEVEGTGLGLALIKKIVDGWGGEVWIESELGSGATFSFSLPKQPTEPEESAGHPQDAPAQPAGADREPREAPRLLDALLPEGRAAVEAFDPDWLRDVLERAVDEFDPSEVVERLLAPLIERVGDLWFQQKIQVRHEHLATAAIRGTLSRILDRLSGSASGGPHLIAATPSGHRHELGLLLASTVAASQGWNVSYLGADLPIDEIRDAIEELAPDVVALSLVYPEEDVVLLDELRALAKSLPKGVELLIGGRAAGQAAPLAALGVRIVQDLGVAREFFARGR